MNCKNCNYQVNSKFCPNCGHPTELKRISGKYIIHEIEHVLHLEKGIFYTIKELFIRPGYNVRTYLTENRSRLVKPIIFIIITSLIYSVCNHIFHIEDGYVQFQDNQPSATKAIFKWVQDLQMGARTLWILQHYHGCVYSPLDKTFLPQIPIQLL